MCPLYLGLHSVFFLLLFALCNTSCSIRVFCPVPLSRCLLFSVPTWYLLPFVFRFPLPSVSCQLVADPLPVYLCSRILFLLFSPSSLCLLVSCLVPLSFARHQSLFCSFVSSNSLLLGIVVCPIPSAPCRIFLVFHFLLISLVLLCHFSDLSDFL